MVVQKIVATFVRQFEKNEEMRKNIIRNAALALLCMLPAMLHAQVNSKPGFVITNGNDTIYGTIDYLSDTKNANECRFKADGATEFKVYKPGDISAYRFTDNGIFYVTKSFSVEGESKTIFAEYLLQGGVNLFHHKEDGTDYFFFTDRDGKIASVKNIGSLLNYSTRTENKNNKRAALREVSQMLAESSKAQHDLWVKDVTANNLTKIAYDYNMEFCTDAGECVEFRYNEKAVRHFIAKFRIQAAIVMNNNKLQAYGFPFGGDDLTIKAVAPQIGIGFDFLLPRSSKHWSLQALGLVSKWDMSKEFYEFYNSRTPKTAKLKYLDLGLQVGAAYSLMPEWKVSPVLRGGVNVGQIVSGSQENLTSFSISNDELNLSNIGYYVGAGFDIPIQKHVLRVSAEYKRTRTSYSKMTISHVAVNAGIRL